MIREILPDAVIAVEARNDPTGIALFPEEAAIVERAVAKRRREFTTARACAHEALAQLGQAPSAVTSGERGEPRWPADVVGSITHCDGYRACAIARSTEIAAIGIDAELNAELPRGVLADIAGPQEQAWLAVRRRDPPAVHWDRLLFSAKESVYKAWFPLTELWLGFDDVTVTFDLLARTFSARLLVSGPLLGGRRLVELSGRWLVRDGFVLTAVALAAAPPS